MSKYYQIEKLTEFKDIETDNTNKRTILQKLWPLNKASSIDDTSYNSNENILETSQEILQIQRQIETTKLNKSNSFRDKLDDLSNSKDSDTNSFNKDFDELSLNKSIDNNSSPNKTQSDKYNIPSVLKQIYALKYLQRTTDVGSSSSREFWMPDDQVKECFECNDKFTTFRRRHHCRVCGQIFCSKCSDHEIPAQLIWPNNTGNIRACTFCHSLVGQLETGDVLHSGSSMNELMKRLSAVPLNSQSNMNSSDKSMQDADMEDALKSVEQNKPINVINDNKLNNPFDISENKNYFKPQENDITKLISNNVSELRNLWVQIYHTSDGITFQTRNINKFKKITNCISSTELIEWLMRKKSVSKDQAIVIGQALVHGKWLICATNTSASSSSFLTDQIFSDEFAYYKPGPAALNSNKTDQNLKKDHLDAEEGPEWIKELNKLVTSAEDEAHLPIITQDSSNPITLSPLSLLKYDTDLTEKIKRERENAEAKRAKQSANFYSTSPTSNTSIASSNTLPVSPEKCPMPTSLPLTILTDSKKIDTDQEMEYDVEMNNFNQSESLQLLHKRLQLELLKQLLILHNLSFDWFDIIIDLVWKAVDLVKPDVKHDNDHMDIRKYIKIKKLSGGSKSDCRIVNGIVFTKNVAHKNMSKDMKNPKILLLRSSIEYQRVEEKLCSLQPLLIAESQYLRNNCSKLLRMSPDILVVEKSVARIAQEFLLQAGVTLVLNVKSRVMDILCRFLQADPMFSIDDLVRKPRLGFCTKFHVDKYYTDDQTELFKPLMYFEGTPTNLGCTLLLCGASLDELAIIKSITNFMIYAAYNSKLEQSFLIDKFAFFSTTKILNENSLLSKLTTTDSVTEIIDKSKHMNQKEIKRKFLMENIDDTLLNDETTSSKAKKFHILIDKLILSCSPFVKYTLPFLLSNEGLNGCSLRKYVPFDYINYYNSKILMSLSNDSDDETLFEFNYKRKKENKCNTSMDGLNKYIENWPFIYEKKIKEPHGFLKLHLIKSLDDQDIRKSYADYRSRGQRVILNHISKALSTDDADDRDLKSDEETSLKNKSRKKLELYDCLDVINRQHLAVLFYSQCDTSPVYPNICIKSRIIDINFYGENDMTLGNFLVRNCFRNGYTCTNDLCNTLVLYHTRYFVHGNSQISIRMNLISDEIPMQLHTPSSPNPLTNIYTSGNNNNNSNTPIPTLLLTTDKSDQSSQNSNSNIIYDDISIYMWSVCRICFKQSKKIAMSPHTWSFSLGKFLELTFYADYYKRLYTGTNDYCSHSLFHQHDQYFRFKNVQTIFSHSKIKICQLDLPPLEVRIQPYLVSKTEYIEEIKDLSEKALTLISTLIERINALKSQNLHDKQIQKLDQYISQINTDMTLKHRIEIINLLLTKSFENRSISQKQSNIDEISSTKPIFTLTNCDDNEDEIEKLKSEEINYNQIELYIIDLKKYIANTIVFWNNKMVDFFKKSSKHDDTVSLDATSETLSFVDVKSYQKNDVDTKKITQKEDECTFAPTYTDIVTYKKQPTYTSDSLDIPNNLNNTDIAKSVDSTYSINQSVLTKPTNPDIETTPTISMKRILANLISNTAFQPLKIPFPEEEHYLLSGESYYYVNDKDLGSIVAFTLSCKEYKEFQLNQNKKQSINTNSSASPMFSNVINPKKLNHSESYQVSSTKENNFSTVNANVEFDDLDTSNLNLKSQFTSDQHFDYQFQDSSAKFYCKVYYADLFHQLRKLLLQDDEEKYIHSLFRCMNWEAKGGKSNSQFRKTLDNRFVLKEMSKQEVQSFLDFAPKYVQYITSCIQNNNPTVLTKIVGAYRICLMKTTALSSSKAVKIDVLVLENLFYSRKHTQVFDLKGSERNRLINVQGKHQEKELVLLDENFLRWSFDNPIYIKCHSKHVLMKAIEADAEFLSSQFVMDYSLLCGFDQVNNKVIVGIIDYVRTFTWDKKLETYIKTIGSQGKMPTIVSPAVYRTRFISAIERYFLEVPDHWFQDSTDME